MLCQEIIAIALGLMASTAYSAPTGIINSRGPQMDEAVRDAMNKLQPARALKSRGLQHDARAPQDPVFEGINDLVNGRRGIQALDTRAPQNPVFEGINEKFNPSSRRARSPQVQAQTENDGGNNKNADQDAAFESSNSILPASSRRSAQGENRNQNGIRPNVPQAQN